MAGLQANDLVTPTGKLTQAITHKKALPKQGRWPPACRA